MQTIAIVIVAFNRINSLTRLLSSVNSAYYDSGDVTLVISVDKSETDVVEKYAESFQWSHGPKIVDIHKNNLGLRSHMMSLGKWFDYFDALIVLEDDLIVSPNFYTFAQQSVEKYHKCESIAGISLYGIRKNYINQSLFTPLKDEHDVYFVNCAISWGEIWMRDSWLEFYEWYEENRDFNASQNIPQVLFEWDSNSWLKYHIRYCIEKNKYFLFPYTSLTTISGDAGVHTSNIPEGISSPGIVPLQQGKVKDFRLPEENGDAVYYDGYFENKAIYQVLGLSEDLICIDLNRGKNNNPQKRYWLTPKVANYSIMKSFKLFLRPIEMNIIQDISGEDIFLYDTLDVKKNTRKDSNSECLYNLYEVSITSIIKKYGVSRTIKAIIDKILRKILCK